MRDFGRPVQTIDQFWSLHSRVYEVCPIMGIRYHRLRVALEDTLHSINRERAYHETLR